MRSRRPRRRVAVRSRRGEWCCRAMRKSIRLARTTVTRLRLSRLRDQSRSATPPSAGWDITLFQQQGSLFRFCQHDPPVCCRFNASESLTGSAISGGDARRDCSEAWRAIRCQRSTRFVAAAARWESVRCAITGAIREMPSSVHFSIAHSMRSNLNTARSRVISTKAAGEISSANSNSTRAFSTTGYSSAAHRLAGGNIEILPQAGAEHADKMIGVLTD